MTSPRFLDKLPVTLDAEEPERAATTKVTIVHSNSITADHKSRTSPLRARGCVHLTPAAITGEAALHGADPRVTGYTMINYDYAGHFAYDHSSRLRCRT